MAAGVTPLAHSLARQLTIAPKERCEFWQNNADRLREKLEDTHFFECTDVIPLMEVVRQTSQEWFDQRTFLPAPKTWIEYQLPNERIAVLLEHKHPLEKWYSATLFLADFAVPLGLASATGDYNVPAGNFAVPVRYGDMPLHKQERFREKHIGWAHTFLVLINSPHIVGRSIHLPHRGLERQLRSKYPSFGRYPLRAWSELKLEATIRHKDERTGEVLEGHLTGKKCLHFCRQHLRVRLGKLELVSPHWRGDPALGIKRTRYKVVPNAAERADARKVEQRK